MKEGVVEGRTSPCCNRKEIKKNGEFVLPGFGKLVKQKRKARSGFNPKTRQKIKIPAKIVVKFRVAKAAKDAILGVKK
jgi:DNA-binding protein HU-beta